MKDEQKKNLAEFAHNLFLKNEYRDWRQDLKSISSSQWHSLIASLNACGAPLEEIRNLGEATYKKLVFSYIKAPDYKVSGMLMVQFTISESMWHSLIWHCPEGK